MLKQLLSSAAALVAATSLCAQNLPEANGDPTNDTFAGAETGALGAQHYGFMGLGDIDWWAITVLPSDVPFQLTAWTSGRGTTNPADDTIIGLVSASGQQLVVNDDFLPGGAQNTFLSVISYGISAPGTYYVGVESWLGVTDGDYALDITKAPIATLNCPGIVPLPAGTETEPNNTCTTSDTITPCTSRVETLQTGGDVDFYCFSLAQTTTVDFETIVDTTLAAPRGDTRLWLYNSACVEIATDDDGGIGLLSRLTIELTPGTYYIEVSDWQRSLPGDYHLSFNTLQVLIPSGTGTPGNTTVIDLNPPTSICGGFPATGVDNEPNSTPAQAQASANIIVPCTDTIGTIGMVGAGVTDMWCFTVASTAVIVFESIDDSTLAGGMTDTKLWLYDSNGTEIASDDDGGAGLFSRLERVYAPGTYYIECHDFARAQAGTFRLRMDQYAPLQRCRGGLGGKSVHFSTRENELVQQNSNVTVDITGAAGPGVVFLSFAGAVILPLGLELSLVGMPQCRLFINPAVATPAYLPGIGSDFEYSYSVGGLPVGAQINLQVGLIDFAAAVYRPALPVTLSDTVVRHSVGDQTFH